MYMHDVQDIFVSLSLSVCLSRRLVLADTPRHAGCPCPMGRFYVFWPVPCHKQGLTASVVNCLEAKAPLNMKLVCPSETSETTFQRHSPKHTNIQQHQALRCTTVWGGYLSLNMTSICPSETSGTMQRHSVTSRRRES